MATLDEVNRIRAGGAHGFEHYMPPGDLERAQRVRRLAAHILQRDPAEGLDYSCWGPHRTDLEEEFEFDLDVEFHTARASYVDEGVRFVAQVTVYHPDEANTSKDLFRIGTLPDEGLRNTNPEAIIGTDYGLTGVVEEGGDQVVFDALVERFSQFYDS